MNETEGYFLLAIDWTKYKIRVITNNLPKPVDHYYMYAFFCIFLYEVLCTSRTDIL